jgi:hypothetical protein
MAKRFGGFTPEQIGKIIPEMQGMQADEQALYLASKPGASASQRLAKMTEAAQKRIGMAYGGMVKQYAIGGSVPASNMPAFDPANPPMQQELASSSPPIFSDNARTMDVQPGDEGYDPRNDQIFPTPVSPTAGLTRARKSIADANTAYQAALEAQRANPTDASLVEAINASQLDINLANQGLNAEQTNYDILNTKSAKEVMNTAFDDPATLVTPANVQKIVTGDTQTVDPTAGQVSATADTATTTTAAAPTGVEAPVVKDPTTITAETSAAAITDTVSKITAATGKPSTEALVDAAQMSPEDLAQIGLTVEQIAEARKVVAPTPRKVETGELIEGSTVDMGRVKKETNFEAATGAPSTDATVQGQLTGLMEQFEGNEPPAWAAGAMRQATATMAARGLGASSMAGQAIIQAAMESALPIAQMDSQTFAKFETQNLSNKQQVAMFAAEKRAEFLGLEFNQSFQSRVTNAAKISDIANINFTAEQQIALENARMAQTVDITNLNAKNAKVMADAAAMTQADLSNLNNRQQQQVQNAKSFLEMDMANLTNEQQTEMFKSQSVISSIFNDQAALNAAEQFNASSENQMTQFYDTMANTVSMFNEEQANSIELFNAGESNAVEQFNKSLLNQREQFNASNSLIIEQANAAWYQSVATADTAAQNLANIQAAKDASELTALGFSAMVQEVRDIMSYAFQTENNNADRSGNIAVATLQAAEARAATEAKLAGDKENASASKTSGFWGSVGTFAAAWIAN